MFGVGRFYSATKQKRIHRDTEALPRRSPVTATEGGSLPHSPENKSATPRVVGSPWLAVPTLSVALKPTEFWNVVSSGAASSCGLAYPFGPSVFTPWDNEDFSQ